MKQLFEISSITSVTVVSLILLLTLSFVPLASSFSVTTTSQHYSNTLRKSHPKKPSNSCLYYKNDPARHRLTVPIIGPLVSASPLIVGSEMTLDSPTPLQWQALEESVVNHMEHNSKNKGDANIKKNEVTTIDGAPIVAIIDEVSGRTTVEGLFPGLGMVSGRYATLAAVVGVRSKSWGSSGETFMESLQRMKETDDDEDGFYFTAGSVRLVGIGRAILGQYYYKVPSQLSSGNAVEDAAKDDDNDESSTVSNVPIVMANFEILHDTGVIGYEGLWEVGKRSKKTSPVHALNLLNTATNKLGRVHDDRLKVIAGLNAAKARLNNVKYNRETEKLEDYDGFGLLSEKNVVDDAATEEMGMTIDEFLATFKGNMQRVDVSELPQNQPSPAQVVANLDNYGVKYYSALSTLSKLTDEALLLLAPYYSPKHKDREEYWFEILSFVAWRALEGFVDANDVAWSLKCRSSVERLERACDVMLNHRSLLRELAEEVSDELRQCGEECTDLW